MTLPLARIIELVRKAQSSKPPIGRLVDKVASVFVPVVIVIALLSFIAWYLVGPEPQLSYAMVTAMTVLVIASPCALGLATPISIMVGVGRAAEQGIGEALQQAGRLTVVVLDKTGTVTEGQPRVTRLIPTAGMDEKTLLQKAATLDVGSEHPLAASIVDAAHKMNLEPEKASDFKAHAGHGVSARQDNRLLRLGNADTARAVAQQVGVDRVIADVLPSDKAKEIAALQAAGEVRNQSQENTVSSRSRTEAGWLRSIRSRQQQSHMYIIFIDKIYI